MNLKWFILLCIVLGSVFLSAQTNCNTSVSGTVTDEHDGSILSYSTVWIPEISKGAVADETGYFFIEDLCSGTYNIVVRHVGCEADTFSFSVPTKAPLNFQLEHHVEELSQIEISGKAGEVNSAGMKTLAEEDKAESLGKPLGEILNKINGVNSLKTGANISKPVISGFSGNRVQILNQGVPLQSQSWGDEHAPELDPFSASEYTVIKGASALKYGGGALGGFVVANSKALPRKAGVNGELNSLYATNNRLGNVSLMLEGNTALIPRFSWRVQGSAKKSGNIKTPNYYQKNTGLNELNGSADLGYFHDNWNFKLFYSQFNSEVGIFSGAHIGNLTDLRNAIDREEPRVEDQEGFSYELRRPYQRIIHELTKAEFNWYPSFANKVNVSFSRQFNIREEFDKETPRNNDLAALGIPEFSLSLESYTANINVESKEKAGFKTEAGAQLILQRNSVNSFTDFIPDYENVLASIYAVEHYKKNQFKWELGFRVDRNQMVVNKLIQRKYEEFKHEFNALSVNLGMQMDYNSSTVLSFNTTYSDRAPAINELYSDGLHHGSASLEFGDNTLGKESSLAVSANLEKNKERVSYELYSYMQYVQNFIYLEPTGFDLTIRGAFPAFEWKNSDALLRGIDQSINFNVSQNIEVGNRLSFLWANNLDGNNYLINMPSNSIENFIQIKRALGKRKTPFRLKLTSQAVLQQNRFNPEEELATPPKGYHLLHAGLFCSPILFNEKRMDVGLRVDNMLDVAYRNYLNRFRYYTDEQGRNITITIKLTF